MRRSALMVAAMIGFGCCVISLIDARAGQPGFGLSEAGQGAHGFAAAPPHHMRGWTHMLPRPLWEPAGQ